MNLRRTILASIPAGLVAMLLTPAVGLAGTVTLQRLETINGSPSQAVGMVRTTDGVLHLMYQTSSGGSYNGLAAISISAAGTVGSPVQALSGWNTTQPALVALPGGTLEAFFGSISPGNQSSVWGITSSDGGATWSAPADVSSGSSDEVFDYASDLTAATSGGTPVLSMPHGDIVMQVGLGPGASTYVLNSASDGDAFDLDQAVDAATGEVVDAWNSIASSPGNYLQGAAPTVGTPELVPGQVHDPPVIAGRDTGPGVFIPYTTDGTHVRLLTYDAGNVPVGAVGSITATNLAAATGPDGRIWVIWGKDGAADSAATRSNKAVTRFEPIQLVDANTFSLWRIFGDGRLGPLDLFADEVPNTKTLQPPGLYYGRVLPELSASISVKKVKSKSGAVTAFRLTVKVNDAGDPAGARPRPPRATTPRRTARVWPS